MDAGQRELIAGYASMLLAIALFSTIEVSSKMLGSGTPPLTLAFIRFFIAGAILLVPAAGILRARQSPLSAEDVRILIGLALVGVTVAITLYHLAIVFLPANAAAIVFSANPVFVALFSPWILGERLTRAKIGAMALGLAGIGVFVFATGADLRSLKGLSLMLGALIAFALYTVLTKKFMPRFGVIVITSLAGLIGSATLFLLAWRFEGLPLVTLRHAYWPGILYISVVATALAYLAFFWGIVNVGASRGAMFFFLKPVLASFFAWLLLGERITAPMVAGTVLILGALVFAVAPMPRRSWIPE